MNWLTKLQDTGVSQYLLGSSWAFYSLLAVHAIGMAVVVGSSVVLGLRVLGFGMGAPISAFERLRALAWCGFAINAASGVLIFLTDATQLAVLWTFLSKMACVLIAGLLLWALWGRIVPFRDVADHDFAASAKLLAGATILFWMLALVFGRYIAYTLPRQ